jgi:hypothetical protein
MAIRTHSGRAAPNNSSDAETIALQALVWTLGDGDRAARLLALTGLDPDSLRAGAGDPAVLAAVIAFLSGHEADLVACAEALDIAPADLARCGELLV